MSELDLLGDVVVTAKSSPAATNRYIYYPDHLVRIPQPRPDQSLLKNLSELWNTVTKEPLFDGVAKDVFHEYWDPAPMSDQRDESIADFISRRFGAKVADNLVSAVMAGIFAGDIDRLSARTLMGALRMREENGSILKELLLDGLAGRSYWKMDDLMALQSLGAEKGPDYWTSLKSLLSGASVFTLKEGLEQFPRAIAKRLQESEKAEVITSANIRYMMHDSSTDKIMVRSWPSAVCVCVCVWHLAEKADAVLDRSRNRRSSIIRPSDLYHQTAFYGENDSSVDGQEPVLSD